MNHSPPARLLCLLFPTLGLLAFSFAADTDGWTSLRVPGTWEQQGEGKFAKHAGYAWYRCYVKVPDSWVGLKLYADSLVLAVSKVDGAHEVYVNGRKLGSAGTLPPQYASGLDTVRRYKVPPGLLQKGVTNVVALRVYRQGGTGGFQGIAPVLSSYEHEIKLEGQWEFRIGDDPAWALKPVDRKPAVALFEKVEEASFPLEPTRELIPGDRLPPKASLQQMKAADDLQLDQVLTEPQVAQPVFMNFDERGRMWVVQYRQYPYPAGLQMVSRNKYYRAVYDKVPPPPPHHFRGADRITIHEDTAGNGVFDKHKTFVDGLNIATSVVRGRGGVWVLNPPYLLFYPDSNDDDVPDGDPVVHLSGFGLEDTHSATNSLCWGPDGWLYATQGSNVVAHVKMAGQEKPTAYLEGPGVWRYHPAKRRFEIFAEGGGNAFGLEIDAQGRIYSGHNGANTRGFYYVQGGYYDKGIEAKYMPVSNPYAFGTLPMMAHAKVPRFTHAFVRYEGAALPRIYNDKLFCVDPLNNCVMVSAITPRGSSFGTTDLQPALTSKDRAFRPVAITVGPDGAVYVADFYEYYIAHGQHFQGQIDPTTGRIYRLRAKDAGFPQPFDLRRKSADELVDLLGHANKWYRQTALRLLADCRDRSVLPRLRAAVEQEKGRTALESLWALYQLGAFDDRLAAFALGHSNPSVRLWTVRLLGDEGSVAPVLAQRLTELAHGEASPEVLCQLAATARRLPAKDALPIVRELLTRDQAVEDPYLPLMTWWALESKCGTNRDAVLALWADKGLWDRPLAAQHILSWLMRRFAATGNRDDWLICAKLLQAAPESRHVELLMRGFEEAFKGRAIGALPDELLHALKRTKLAESLPFRLRLGEASAVKEALVRIADAKTEPKRLLELLEVFAEVEQPDSVPVLLHLLESPVSDPIRIAVLTALQRYAQPQIGDTILRLYAKLSPDAAAAAQTVLVSRPMWTLQLLDAVDRGSINRKSIPADAVRKMLLHSDKRIPALVRKHWETIQGPTDDEMRGQIQKFSQVIAGGTGNPYAGRKHFDNLCGKCHTLFGLGGKIGPDLTSYKRDDLPTLLINIVNPSAEIREGYETYVVATSDGRLVTGFLAGQDKQVVSLRTQDGQTITIARDRIEDMQKQARSLMPENLLKDLSDQDLRDLFAYVRSSQPGR